MNQKIVAFCGPLLFLFGAGFLAAQGFWNLDQGVRAAALGGAFVARADDASAIFYNPAGLAFLPGFWSKIDLSYYRSTTKAGISGDQGQYETGRAQLRGSYYLTLNVKQTVGLGIGLFFPDGMETEWEETWPGRGLAISSKLETAYLRPAFSIRISKHLAVGAGVDFIMANQAWKFERHFTFKAPVVKFPPDLYNATKVKGNGVGFVFSALFKPGANFQVGARYRPKVKLDLEGDTSFVYPGYEWLIFSGHNDTRSTLTMGEELALGGMFSPLKGLTVQMDVLRTGTSALRRWEFVVDPDSYADYEALFGVRPDFKDLRVDLDLRNTTRIMFGIEYVLRNSFTLRAGYTAQRSAVDDAHLHPVFPDLGLERWSFGIGYEGPMYSILNSEKRIGDFSFDLCFQFGPGLKRTSSLPDFKTAYRVDRWLVGTAVGFAF